MNTLTSLLFVASSVLAQAGSGGTIPGTTQTSNGIIIDPTVINPQTFRLNPVLPPLCPPGIIDMSDPSCLPHAAYTCSGNDLYQVTLTDPTHKKWSFLDTCPENTFCSVVIGYFIGCSAYPTRNF
ncbi:UNVERIFIED_CONTAM: hypothetical protein HDU68_012752 [Siphonaria sp. JEL0065]|nr:hypothetical protein HDU68_012752 [Siphonaria sp. JEL0065]